MFVFLEHELKKVLHDTLARQVWTLIDNGLVIFYWFVPRNAHASYPVLFFSPTRVQRLYGGGEKGEFRVQGLDYPGGDLGSSKTTRQNK